MEEWRIDDLVAHLRAKGLELRVVPAMQNGPLSQGAYLTTTSKSWGQLSTVPTASERLADWDGTVYCFRGDFLSRGDLQLWLWGDSYMRVGPFLIFGDPRLRERIHDALRDVGVRGSPFSPVRLQEQPAPACSVE
jgi:hypothetical protein